MQPIKENGRDMTASESPTPKRSRRMVVWLVAVPIVILLLALAGANWKTFHLAYAKLLIHSSDPDTQRAGVYMVGEAHLRDGMSLEEVRRLLAPAEVTHAKSELSPGPRKGRSFYDVVAGDYVDTLLFDEDDRLIQPSGGTWYGALPIPAQPPPGK